MYLNKGSGGEKEAMKVAKSDTKPRPKWRSLGLLTFTTKRYRHFALAPKHSQTSSLSENLEFGTLFSCVFASQLLIMRRMYSNCSSQWFPSFDQILIVGKSRVEPQKISRNQGTPAQSGEATTSPLLLKSSRWLPLLAP